MGSISKSNHVIQAAGPKDSPAMIEIGDRAFVDDPIQAVVFPKELKHLTSAEDLVAWRTSRHRERFENDKVFFWKVTDPADPNRLLGYAGWFAPRFFEQKSFAELAKDNDKLPADATSEKTKDVSEQTAKDDTTSGFTSGFPDSLDREAHKQIMEATDKTRKTIWGDETNYWYLGSLAVDPDFQRQGIASALIKWGTDRADEEQLPVFLEATPVGSKVYTRHGFELVGTTPLFDGKAQMEHYVRQPKPVTEAGVGKSA